MSRIGKKPVGIPEDVKVNIGADSVTVEGGAGKMTVAIPPRIKAEIKEGKVLISRAGSSPAERALHGTIRSLLVNALAGVRRGFSKELEIVGVGFRGQVKEKCLVLQLGFSHPINYPIPEGIEITTPKPTQIIIRGIDKAKVGQVASDIRDFYRPEPYKGKGIRYQGEYVRRKAGKAVV